MELLKSLGTASEDVFTMHHYGETSPENVVLDGYRAAGSEIFRLSFGYKNKPGIGLRTWPELRDHSVDLTKFGPWLVYASSSKKTAFPEEDIREGGFAYHEEESMDRMGGWKAATELCTIEYVLKPSRGMFLAEGAEYVPDYSQHCPSMPNVNVPIRHWSGENVDINKVGIRFSQIENTHGNLRDVIFRNYFRDRPGFDPETEALSDFLASKKLGPGRDLLSAGIEDYIEPGAIAATYINDVANLTVSTNFYQDALNHARAYGLDEGDVDVVKKAFLFHEFVHAHKRKISSDRKEEIKVSELLAEFYEKRADMVDEKLAKCYRALAKYNRDYAQRHKISAKNLMKSLWSKIRALKEKYTSEAKAMELSEEETRDYVEKRLEQEIGDEESDLERIADEETEDKETKTDTKADEEYSGKRISSEKDAQEEEESEQESDDAPAEEA